MSPPDPCIRHVRVGVFDGTANDIVIEATLPPASDVIVGTDPACTVPLPAALGIDRHVLILGGAELRFTSGMRLNAIASTATSTTWSAKRTT
jgi:hypothetical protein